MMSAKQRKRIIFRMKLTTKEKCVYKHSSIDPTLGSFVWCKEDANRIIDIHE